MKQINRLKVVPVEQNRAGKWLTDTIGYDVAAVSRWHSNVTQPLFKVLYEIAELLDVGIKDLLISNKRKN